MEAGPLGIRMLDCPCFSISRDPTPTSQQVGPGPVRSEMDVEIVIYPAPPRFSPNRRPPCMIEPERDQDDDTYDAVFSESMTFFRRHNYGDAVLCSQGCEHIRTYLRQSGDGLKQVWKSATGEYL